MAPRFRVGANVVSFTTILALSTAGALAYTRLFGVSDDEKEKALREKYRVDHRQAEVRRQNMQDHFNKMKDRSGDVDAKVDAILKAGKGGMKRHYPLEIPVTETTKSGECTNKPQSEAVGVASSPDTVPVPPLGGATPPVQSSNVLTVGSWWAWWGGR